MGDIYAEARFSLLIVSRAALSVVMPTYHIRARFKARAQSIQRMAISMKMRGDKYTDNIAAEISPRAVA